MNPKRAASSVAFGKNPIPIDRRNRRLPSGLRPPELRPTLEKEVAAGAWHVAMERIGRLVAP
jgi:hypothetical protein